MLKQTELGLHTSSTDTIFSVSEFTTQVKGILESSIPATWVRGQVSNVRRQSSGHIYFTLKDEASQISSVLFRGNVGQQGRFLQDGKQVIIFGELSVYEPRGTYQIITRWVLEDGIGKLQAEFEKLKQQLSSEGVFDKAKKKPLPSHPKTIGIITSPTGAAIQDFISILKRRHWGGRILLFPAIVQGEEAAQNMVKCLTIAETIKDLDLLIIGRGGGSLEDLWAFNEEPLVRAIANCSIPIISAVGHEIDFTLCDFAADVRAETPSGAAELISSGYCKHIENLNQLKQHFHHHVAFHYNKTNAHIKWVKSQLSGLSPQKRLELLNLRLDDLTRTFSFLANRQFQNKKQYIVHLHTELKGIAPLKLITTKKITLLGLKKRLEGLSVESTLKRGFTLIKTTEGNVLTQNKGLKQNQLLSIQFNDGVSTVKVVST